MRNSCRILLSCLLLCAVVSACSSTSTPENSATGGTAAGGSSGTASGGAGGSLASTVAASGGTAVSGGSSAEGGLADSGGSKVGSGGSSGTSGGATSASGGTTSASGGTTSISGGRASNGGTGAGGISTGGTTSASGGTTSTSGGRIGTGGTSTSGGTTGASGGTPSATGGTTSASGGRISTGGTSTGGGTTSANGGSSSTGGSSTGGTTSASGGSSGGTGGKPDQSSLPAITVHLAGDSTMSNYAATTTQEGWGQEFGQFFISKVTIDNQAQGGANVQSFYSGKWKTLIGNVQAGDYVMAAFGINDSGTTHGPVSVPDFTAEFETMADEVAAKKATFIPTTSSPLQVWVGGKETNDRLQPYCDATIAVGKTKNLLVDDLNARGVEYYNSVGQTVAATLTFNGDKAHFDKAGATEMAQLAAQELTRIGSPLAAYLK